MAALRLAKELDQASPEDIKHSAVLRTALERYLSRCDGPTRRMITPWIRRRTREKPSQVESFFHECRTTSTVDEGKRKTGIDHLVKAVKTIESEIAAFKSLSGASDFWNRPRPFAGCEQGTEPAQSLVRKYMELDKALEETEHAKRFVLLFIDHGIESQRYAVEREMTNNGDNNDTALSIAIQLFAARHGDTVADVEKCRTDVRPYREMARRFGLGVLFLMGSQTKKLWRKTSTEEIGWLLQYCQEHFKVVFTRVKELSPEVKSVVTGGLAAFGLDIMDQSYSTTLQRMFQRDCDVAEAPLAEDAMGTLAAAAASAALDPTEGDSRRQEWSSPLDQLSTNDPSWPISMDCGFPQWNTFFPLNQMHGGASLAASPWL